MSTMTALCHTLVSGVETTWTIAQEKSLNRDYPFQDLHDETDDLFVARTYLQFLWLPEVSRIRRISLSLSLSLSLTITALTRQTSLSCPSTCSFRRFYA